MCTVLHLQLELLLVRKLRKSLSMKKTLLMRGAQTSSSQTYSGYHHLRKGGVCGHGSGLDLSKLCKDDC